MIYLKEQITKFLTSYLDAVPHAVNNARIMLYINMIGFFLVPMKYTNGNTINP
jgi:hypothetical protein